MYFLCNARVDFYCTCNNNIHGKIKSYLLFAVRYALIYKILISGAKSTLFSHDEFITYIGIYFFNFT